MKIEWFYHFFHEKIEKIYDFFIKIFYFFAKNFKNFDFFHDL